VLVNVKELITPYIEQLKKSGLDEKEKAIVNIIESNIRELISPFAHSLTALHISLTPRETRIANLIRQGKTSKEISECLECSFDVVLFHRSNIRKKLGILGKKVNLKSYLIAKAKAVIVFFTCQFFPHYFPVEYEDLLAYVFL
jgi:DNA-binding CsgD family transcriptional regulator